MIARGILAAMVLLLCGGALTLAAPAETTIIEGQVTNGTAGGSMVADVQVVLYAVDGGDPVQLQTASTDVTGHFAFTGLDLAVDGNVYVVGATHEGVDYFSEVLDFSENVTSRNIELAVYDTTTDDSAITIVNAHTVILPDENGVTIQELYVFANMSDRTYIGVGNSSTGARGTLRFSLPPGFTDLELGGDLASAGIMASDTGFVDTLAVQPGARQAFYSYRVPLTSGEFVYSRKIDYRTVKYSMLVRGEGISVQSNILKPAGTIDMGGTAFTSATGANLVAGATLSATFSGLGGGRKGNVALWVGIGVAIAGLGAAGLYVVKRRRPEFAAVEEAEDEERLLSAIADLDEDFEGGRIADTQYRVERARIKAAIVELERTRGSKAGS